MTIARLLIIGALARLAFAYFLPLGVDENYAIAVAREFSWSFFDHPPLGFWSGVLVPSITGVESPLAYRFPFLIYGTITIYLMYLIGRELHSERAGIWTAALYTIAPFFFLSGSVFVVPDGPLNLAAAIVVLYLLRIQKFEVAPLRLWLCVGVGLALAMMSKYQAGLIPIAMVIYALFASRRWFLQPGPYIASLIGLIGLVPVILWNVHNDWISFAFQSGRSGGGLAPDNFLRMLLGQILYLLPPIFVLMIIGIRRLGIVGTIAILPILMFNIIFLFSQNSLPHWTMPGWQFALPLAAVWILQTDRRIRLSKRWIAGFSVPVWALLIIALLHVNTGILSNKNTPIPDWDNTSEIFDYSPLRSKLLERDLTPDFLLTTGWINAGRLGTAVPTIPMSVLFDPHHFQFMSSQNTTGVGLLMSAVKLDNAEKAGQELLDQAREIDPNAIQLDPIILDRGGRPYLAVPLVELIVR